MDINESTLCWIAGLFEGEAYFGRGIPSEPTIPRLAIHTTDEDVIARVAEIFGHSYTFIPPRKNYWKPTYKVTLKGAPCVALMRKLRPLMGARRQQQIVRALENYVDRPNTKITTPKLTDDQVRAIRLRFENGETARSIAKDYPVSHFTIWGIRSGKTWKHVKGICEEETTSDLTADNEECSALDSEEKCLYWLVGLLEGEGSFMKGAPSSPNTPRISIAMTDEDVIASAAEICDVRYQSLRPRSEKHKNVYRIMVKGKKAVELMRRVLPLMGKRRQEQIEKILQSYIDPTPSKGVNNPSAKLTEAEAKEIKIRLLHGEPIHSLAREFEVSNSIVREIKYGRTWKHINT